MIGVMLGKLGTEHDGPDFQTPSSLFKITLPCQKYMCFFFFFSISEELNISYNCVSYFRQKKLEQLMDEEGLKDEEVLTSRKQVFCSIIISSHSFNLFMKIGGGVHGRNLD